MSLSIVTWNILADSYVHAHRYPNVKPAVLEPTARRRLLCEQIVEMSADIYLLQEVERAAFDAVRDALGDDYAGTLALKSNRPEGSAIFVRRSAVTLAQVHTHVYARQNGDRGTLALLAHAVANGRSFGLATTHLDWTRNAARRDEDVGLAQISELLNARASVLPDGAPWIVGGDFNAISTSPTVAEAVSRGLRLSCRSQRPWDTININGRRRKVDYLLYTPEHFVPTPGRLPALTRDVPMPSIRCASDHLPLAVEFAWTGRVA